jgi:outer membrane protein assembly factor BamA
VTLNPLPRREARAAVLVRSALLVGMVSAVGATGCVRKDIPRDACTRPDLGGCIIEDVDILENDSIGDGDIEESIATAETSRVLAGAVEKVPILSVWDSLTVEYELFDRFVLERDLARIERYYRTRGFYEAHARAGRVIKLEDRKVRVEIAVDEGPPIDTIRIEQTWVETDEQRALGSYPHAEDLIDAKTVAQNELNDLRSKARFEEADYDAMKKAVVRALTDRGYAYARIEARSHVDLPTRTAHITVSIEPGPFCTFGDIQLVGLGELDADVVRAAIDIDKGDDFSTELLDSAEYALAELGVFGSVEIATKLSGEGQVRQTAIPVVFTFQPTKLHQIKLGVGAELGERVEAHVVAGWQDKDFLGGLRRFNVEGRPGIVFSPASVSAPFPINDYLPEVKLNFDFRQPSFIEARTALVVSGRFSLLQYRTGTDDCGFDPGEEEQNLIGYREYAGLVGAERTFLKGQHLVAANVQLQLSQPFSYNVDKPPPGFRDVIIPYLEQIATLDLRKNAEGRPEKITPHKGIYVAAKVQEAFDLFKGQGGSDVRFEPEFRGYLPVAKKVVLAARVYTGFLFPRTYGEAVRAAPKTDVERQAQEATESPDQKSAREASLARDLQLLSFRGFFSGGVNSNRGYGYRGVGPHAQLDSLFLETTDADCRIPTGGFQIWEASLELRFPLSGALRSAFFVDASNVTLEAISLERPHMSAGIGLRYDTPVGPLRGDIGYRIPCLQAFDAPNCSTAPEDEGRPGDIFGAPIAVSIAIGEAF